MKNVFKFVGALVAVFGALLGALLIFDKITNKHRIEGDYLECNTETPEEE